MLRKEPKTWYPHDPPPLLPTQPNPPSPAGVLTQAPRPSPVLPAPSCPHLLGLKHLPLEHIGDTVSNYLQPPCAVAMEPAIPLQYGGWGAENAFVPDLVPTRATLGAPSPITHSWGAPRAQWSSSQPSRPGVRPASWLWPGPRSTAPCPRLAGGRGGVPDVGDWPPLASAPCASPRRDMGSPAGTQAGVGKQPDARRHDDLARLVHPPCHLPYILVKLLCQFSDVTQDTLGVVLIRPHPRHLMGHQLGEKVGSGRLGKAGSWWWGLLPTGRGRTSSNRSVGR